MEFAFTSEQQLISDTAQSFLEKYSGSDDVRKAMETPSGFDPLLWENITDNLQWQGTHIPEQYGGAGLSFIELIILLEQMGRHLLCSPFFSTVCLGMNSLLIAGSEAQKSIYLPKLSDASMTATLAYTGPRFSHTADQWGADAVQAHWSKDHSGYRLNGQLRYVPDGHTADLLIVAAREVGSDGCEGVSLFIVPAETTGISRRVLPTIDQTRKQATVELDNVSLHENALLGRLGKGWRLLEKILNLATICVAAEQVGGAHRVLDMTVNYTKQRIQFGRPVASFQAVKHQAADMMLNTEVSRSAVYYAASIGAEALSSSTVSQELAEAASVAKSYCSKAYFSNAATAIQLHGGVGFTWEYDVHLFFKRAKSSEIFLGDSSYHWEKIAHSLLDE